MERENRVSCEVAKLLKEKGYNIDCNAVYDLEKPKSCEDGKIYFNFDEKNPNRFLDLCSAPTFIGVKMWLLEVHGLFVEITPNVGEKDGFSFSFKVYKKNDISFYEYRRYPGYFSDFRKTVNAAIKYCLELI